jgi:predicted nucleic acid-binding protein
MIHPDASGAAEMAAEFVLDVSHSCARHDTLAPARSHHLNSYDAAYLELALGRGMPLAMRDKALLKPGHP